MWKPVAAIALGSVLGALLRWWFGLRLNGLLPQMPIGTLAANLVAAYVIGMAIAFFATMPQLSPQWRLLVITGFCGGLSTFSTFSAELAALVQRGQFGWGLGVVATHVLGSLLLTFAGMGTVAWLRAH
ncbi:fluoride efflux transporter CrcB [Xanthomonas massiliensis]|jgi:CrcB protein|uniref:fluoride efflux transporter CrcB n=1 Tax=Xanthomonas massiliensis TaxID=1720302 RepID=UPI000826CC26|nr:fluoride efflux transporter CrcB [Xanthomonas massiliensis]